MREKTRIAEPVLWAALALMMALALKSAWNFYSRIPMTDPIGYIDLARDSRFFFDTTPREPLHIFLVKLTLPFFQQPEIALRLLTVLFTFISFGILAFWMRKTVGLLPALLASLGFLSSSLIAYYSVQGFNMVSYVTFLLLFLMMWDEGKPWWVLGIVAGLTALTRLEGLPVCGLCLLVDGLVQSRQSKIKAFRRSCGSILIAFLMVCPYFIHQKISHGSFLYSHHIHAAFWADRQAVSEAGFPPPSAAAVNSFNEPMGLLHFFTDKGLAQGILQFLKGLWLALIWYTPRLLQGTPWEWFFVPLGLLYMFRFRRWKPLLLWGAAILPVAFILPINAVGPGSGVELRFLLPWVPLLCAFSGMGAAWLLGLFRKSEVAHV